MEEFFAEAGDPALSALPFLQMVGHRVVRAAHPGLGPHRNPGVEICLCCSGVFRWEVEGEAVTIRPGELSVTCPWELHGGVDSLLGPGRLAWIIISADGEPGRLSFGGAHTRAADEPLPELLPCGDEQWVSHVLTAKQGSYVGALPGAESVFDALISEVRQNRPARVAMVRSLTASLLIGVARAVEAIQRHGEPHTPESGPPEAILDTLRVVAEDPGRSWTTAQLAAHAGVGVTSFTSWCRRATGRSPRWFILEQRVERARELLHTTGMTVTEIALETGFSSSQHLSSAFRRLTGSTPTEHRRGRS